MTVATSLAQAPSMPKKASSVAVESESSDESSDEQDNESSDESSAEEVVKPRDKKSCETKG